MKDDIIQGLLNGNIFPPTSSVFRFSLKNDIFGNQLVILEIWE